jgi:hypothetical protein
MRELTLAARRAWELAAVAECIEAFVLRPDATMVHWAWSGLPFSGVCNLLSLLGAS